MSKEVSLRKLMMAGAEVFLSATFLAACDRYANIIPQAEGIYQTASAPSSPEITSTSERLTFSPIEIVPLEPDVYAINLTTEGIDTGITLKVSYRLVGTKDWTVIKELGVPDFTEENRPIWQTKDLPRGEYEVIAQARINDEQQPDWSDAFQSSTKHFTLS